MAVKSVHTFLNAVRERPSMYVSFSQGSPLRQLEDMIAGYYCALSEHGIAEAVPAMSHHFLTWLGFTTRWGMSNGWAFALEKEYGSDRESLSHFFALLDEYQKLKLKHCAWVRLEDRHAPTGKRVIYGNNGRIARPDRIEIIRYYPAQLHFMRLTYSDHVTDSHILEINGRVATTLDDAKQWALDVFQIELDCWRSCSESTTA